MNTREDLLTYIVELTPEQIEKVFNQLPRLKELLKNKEKTRKDQVYMIRHNVTGRMYIGRSKELEKRIYSHFNRLRSGKHPVEDMQEDFDLFGDDFTISILGEITNEHIWLEKEMQEKYQSTVRGIGYNYNDPRITAAIRNRAKPRKPKAMLRELVASLTDDQALCAYTFLSKLFGIEKTERRETGTLHFDYEGGSSKWLDIS